MSFLFVIVLLIAFGLWLAASIPGSRVPEWSARLGFLIVALIWALPRIGG